MPLPPPFGAILESPARKMVGIEEEEEEVVVTMVEVVLGLALVEEVEVE